LALFGFLNIGFVDVIDILVVAFILYVLFNWLRGSSAVYIFTAIVLLLIIRIAAAALNMKMLSSLLGTVLDLGAIALVVIFQPEIRAFLSRLGRTTGIRARLGKLGTLFERNKDVLQTDAISELCDACIEMGEQKTGALIVIRGRESLQNIIDTGDTIDADIRCRLIENIFFKNSPLHDGAMVIGGGRIIAARCTLPITQRTDIPARYGMRHKAAVGISELTDATVIIVSEQTGKINVARDGVLTGVTGKASLVHILTNSDEQK